MLQNSGGTIPSIIYLSWGDSFTKITMQMVSPTVVQLGGPDRTFYYLKGQKNHETAQIFMQAQENKKLPVKDQDKKEFAFQLNFIN